MQRIAVRNSKRRWLVELLERRSLLSGALASADAAPESAALAAAAPPRVMENLGRGVVAVRASSTQVLVSWRLLGLDPAGIGFNVYRSANGAAAQKLNGSLLTGGTNFTDSSANLAANNSYFVRPVINGVEGAASGAFTLTANHAVEPIVRIPLQAPAAGYSTKFVWVGDLDGDSEFDFVIDRLAPFDPNDNDIGLGNQFLEAYTRAGTRLWSIDLGHTSRNTYNIEPGAATVSMGNWDGVTVRDMDSDGKAEVLLKTANGVTFADGQVLTAANDSLQFISVINGMTGVERARIQFANDYLSDGAMGMMFGVGSVDGVNPSLYIKAKNRVGSGSFNETVQTYRFDGTSITRQWKWNRGSAPAPDGHQFRIIDLDGDGKDEFCEVGFTLNSNGTFRYSLQTIAGVIHGDRFHIGDLDPNRPGLEGYGVQQNNATGLLEYCYDATDGTMLWQHFGGIADVGRGMAADIDPRFPGMEAWSFSGLFNAATNTLAEPDTSLRPWPQLGLWWDGDLLHELLNDGKFEYWDWLNPKSTSSLPRFFRASNYGAVGSGVNPLMYGDILGDWREEAIYTNSAQNELVIFTTNLASPHRIYTLAHNPAYRNGMTLKGYMQSHHLDYFLGDGMAAAPVPNIRYAGGEEPPPPPPGPVYPAEDATWGGGTTIDADRAGYNGTGFANFPGTGGFLEFDNVYGGAAGGNFTLSFRYANGAGGARAGSLIINGVSQPISFAPTGGWTQWQTYTLTAPLTAGVTNIVRLESTGADLGNIDELVVAAPPALGAVAGQVFHDIDDSGTRDAGEPLVGGLTVFLDADGDALLDAGEASTTSSAAAGYSFASVPAGTYTVRVLAGLGYVQAAALAVVVSGGGSATSNAGVERHAYAGTSAAEHYRLRRSASGKHQIFVNEQLAFTVSPGVPSLAFDLGGGDDVLTIDLSGGNPLPVDGVSFDGGAGTGDTLAVLGSAGADGANFTAGSVVLTGTVTHLNAERRTFAGNGGSDSLTVGGGAVMLADDVKLANLAVAAGAVLDVREHDVIVDHAGDSPIGSWNGSAYTGIAGSIREGRIASSSATGVTAVGLSEASTALGISGTQTKLFAGHSVDATSVLLKYTYAGDANLSGRVDGDDYFVIDSKVTSAGAWGWWNGDFDYTGKLTGDDYFLIDSTIGRQGGVVL
ncbi:MAG TPA: carbohydrate-binding protein [Tepidisphaeraceae bacterium]|nr:carbohydrate-binding protein [Tepidisphaeraceae bacterium]